jgi:uncharacterized phage protein (TIGR02220 family)
MILKIQNLREILQSGVSMYQRGLLVTIMAVKDSNPKMTLAKFKIVTNMKEANLALVLLQKKGLIEWSGYKNAVKNIEKKSASKEVIEIIDFMNNMYSRKFDPNSAHNITILTARLKKYSIDDIKLVISNRYINWKDDKVMNIHLNPGTIFRAKNFDKYFEDAQSTRIGEGMVKIDKLQIKHGDELSFEHVHNIAPKHVYTIKAYKNSLQNERFGNGITSKIYGKDLKRLLKSEHNRLQRGEFCNTIYIYQNN